MCTRLPATACGTHVRATTCALDLTPTHTQLHVCCCRAHALLAQLPSAELKEEDNAAAGVTLADGLAAAAAAGQLAYLRTFTCHTPFAVVPPLLMVGPSCVQWFAVCCIPSATTPCDAERI